MIKRIALCVAAGAVLAWHCLFFVVAIQRPHTGIVNWDFSLFYAAASVMAHGGNPYDSAGSLAPAIKALGFTPPGQLWAPPLLLLFFSPLLSLPFYGAAVVWRVVNLLCMIATAAAVGRALRWPLWSEQTALVVLLLASYEPTMSNVLLGQVQLPMVLLLAFSVLCLRDHHDRAAGVTLALATLIKLIPGLVLIYLLLSRRYAALGAACLTFLGAVLLWAAILGPNSIRHYVLHVLPAAGAWTVGRTNEAIAGFCNKLLIGWPYGLHPLVRAPGSAPVIATVATLLVLCGTVAVCHWPLSGAAWIGHDGHPQEDRSLALYIVTALLIAPVTEEHYLVLLTIPVAIAYGTLGPLTRRARAVLWLLVAFGWLAVRQGQVVTALAAWTGQPALNVNPLLHAWPFYSIVALWCLLATQVYRERTGQ